MKRFFLLLSVSVLTIFAANAANVKVVAEDVASASFSKDGITVSAEKATGSTAPTYNGNGKDIRLYAKNTMTVSSESAISSIVFTLSSQGVERMCDIAASVGACVTDSEKNTVTWIGSATSVVLTVGDSAYAVNAKTNKHYAGQLCFTDVEFVVEGSLPVDTTSKDTTSKDTVIVVPTTDSLTVVEAIAVAEKLGANDTTEAYYVTGYVTSIKDAWSDKYQNITFFVGDTKDAATTIQAFRATPEVEAEKNVKVGDKVVLNGRLINYNAKTPEIYYPSYKIVEVATVDTTIVEPNTIAVTFNYAECGYDEEYSEEGSYYAWDLFLVNYTDDKNYDKVMYVPFYSSSKTAIAGTYKMDDEDIDFVVYTIINGTDTTKIDLYDAVLSLEYTGKDAEGYPTYNVSVEAYDSLDNKYVVNLKNFSIVCYDESDESVIVMDETGEGPVVGDDVLTVAEAIAIAEVLDNKAVSSDTYSVKGYVTEVVEAYNAEHDNLTVYISDTKGGSNDFELYRLTPETEDDRNVHVGDLVFAQGYIQKWYETLEMVKGSMKILVATGLELVDAADFVVANDGKLIITANDNVQIYNIAGQLMFNSRVDGNVVVDAQAGQLLLVRVGNKITKVIL